MGGCISSAVSASSKQKAPNPEYDFPLFAVILRFLRLFAVVCNVVCVMANFRWFITPLCFHRRDMGSLSRDGMAKRRSSNHWLFLIKNRVSGLKKSHMLLVVHVGRSTCLILRSSPPWVREGLAWSIWLRTRSHGNM